MDKRIPLKRRCLLKQAIYDSAIPFQFITANELVGRDQLVEQLKQQLYSRDITTFVALHGLPGVGKTALAIALASDPNVREEFCEGILWAGLGTQPKEGRNNPEKHLPERLNQYRPYSAYMMSHIWGNDEIAHNGRCK